MKIDANYLVSRDKQPHNTLIDIMGTIIGSNNPIIIAGPCAIHGKEELISLAITLKQMGVNILRGGTFKPRTSPYSFQGLEEEGLEYLIAAKKATGLPIITELTSLKYLDKYVNDIDIIQVGSRNMHNYELLKELGKTKKPILLKRGMSSTYEEWLMSAEYILKNGNPNVILCERGIRTFETETRNTLDLQAIPVLKKKTHLPIIVDPSHASGHDYIIESMSLAAIAAGANGVMIEVEKDINTAVCDKEQTIDLDQLKVIIDKINRLKTSLLN